MTGWAWFIRQLRALNSSKHQFFSNTPWAVLHVVGFLSLKRDIGKNIPKEIFA